MNSSVLCIFVVLLIAAGRSLRILGIFPIPSRSHYILGNTLMRNLAERGHDVTVMSPYEERDPPKNGSYRNIVLSGFPELGADKTVDLFDMDQMNPVLYLMFMNFVGNRVSESILNHTNTQKLLRSNENFDVVILEQFLNDALKAFAYHYKVPLILFSTFGSNAWVNSLVANPAPPSYVPELMISFSHANFFDRLKNTAINVVGSLNRHLFFFPAQNRIMKKYFPDCPGLDELAYNASLILLNSHISTNQAVPRVPSMIDVGGYHVKPAKSLPQDLQKFLDNSKNGVIYFSMGSALKSSDLPELKRNSILKAFASLKMDVLWKWEDGTLPGQPNNVKLSKWFPQQDILAHPNVKLFITHGGLLSLIETVYHGVPVLAIPVFGDQKINAASAASNGYGLYLPFSEVTEDKFRESIMEILTDPKYNYNVRRRSEVMHDRQNSPMDTVEYWIKYVVRHQGAPHLRVSGLSLEWYQYLSLDVAVVVTAFALTAAYLFIYLFGILCKRKPSKLKQT